MRVHPADGSYDIVGHLTDKIDTVAAQLRTIVPLLIRNIYFFLIWVNQPFRRIDRLLTPSAPCVDFLLCNANLERESRATTGMRSAGVGRVSPGMARYRCHTCHTKNGARLPRVAVYAIPPSYSGFIGLMLSPVCIVFSPLAMPLSRAYTPKPCVCVYVCVSSAAS